MLSEHGRAVTNATTQIEDPQAFPIRQLLKGKVVNATVRPINIVWHEVADAFIVETEPVF
jgi:hypothetical protein